VSHTAVACVVCPVGTECGIGSTLEALPLRKGYYRVDNHSVDVRLCPDARGSCSSTFGTAACDSTSGCVGGSGNPCAPGMTGVYCELCDLHHFGGARVYYKRASKDEMARCIHCSDTLGQTLAWLAGGLALVILACAARLYLKRKLSAQTKARLRYLADVFTPISKAKYVHTADPLLLLPFPPITLSALPTYCRTAGSSSPSTRSQRKLTTCMASLCHRT
jgi:hypothetical protein